MKKRFSLFDLVVLPPASGFPVFFLAVDLPDGGIFLASQEGSRNASIGTVALIKNNPW